MFLLLAINMHQYSLLMNVIRVLVWLCFLVLPTQEFEAKTQLSWLNSVQDPMLRPL